MVLITNFFKGRAVANCKIIRDSRTVQTARCHSLTLRTILANHLDIPKKWSILM